MSKFNFEYDTGTIYTDTPKMFYGFLENLDVVECGVSVASRAVSTINETNNAPVIGQKEIVHIPFDCAKKAVRLYKELLKYLDIQEVEQLKLEHKLFDKMKKNDFSEMYLVYFNVLVLFLINKGKYAPLAAFYLALSLLYIFDVTEALRIARALLTSEECKRKLDAHLSEYGVRNLVDAETKREDAMLYVKVRDNKVHIH